jgi:hypothetical protein
LDISVPTQLANNTLDNATIDRFIRSLSNSTSHENNRKRDGVNAGHRIIGSARRFQIKVNPVHVCVFGRFNFG